jgi:probable HAF family extracellular repeat protein
MKITHSSKIQSLVVAATLSIGLYFVSPVSAQERNYYLLDTGFQGLTGLGTLGKYNVATGINDAGQVVGWSGIIPGDSSRAFITGPNGVGMTDIGTLGGFWSIAFGINNSGQVAGVSDTGLTQTEPGSPVHAFITGPNGMGMTDLGTLGGSDSSAQGINDAGQVAGNSFTATGEPHAFITSPDGVGMTDLGTLGGSNSHARGINDAGQVVGDSFTATGEPHAFITGPDGVGMTDLGALGGGWSVALGINDTGQVVGYSGTAAGDSHAFITGPDGVGITDLNSLLELPAGFVITEAVDINNVGQVIVAAIPEPQSYALMLVGLILIGFLGRRKSLLA